MDWGFAAQWRTGNLTASIGDHFIYIHIELGAAACHPDVKRKLIPMHSREDFVANPDNQIPLLLCKPAAALVSQCRRFLKDGISVYQFARHQVVTDAEVLERTLCLRTPQLVGRHLHLSQAIPLGTELAHGPPFELSCCMVFSSP